MVSVGYDRIKVWGPGGVVWACVTEKLSLEPRAESTGTIGFIGASIIRGKSCHPDGTVWTFDTALDAGSGTRWIRKFS